MKYNLSFKDILVRYVIMVVILMAGALTQQVWLMFLACRFITALLECVLYIQLWVSITTPKLLRRRRPLIALMRI
ncbi:MAG: hypothetical protein IPL35_04285 [Sphingobacteriales bacterium]|nr:hypothetical protein [Sphingobacteriales bacterium]